MSTTVKPRTTTVPLYQGDDRERIEELLADVQQAVTSGPARLNDTQGAEAVEAYNTFIAEAEQRAVKVTLHALGRIKWRAMVKDHTTTKTVKDAEGVESESEDLDMEGFADVLVPASILEPAFDTTAERDVFLDSLNDADYNRLFTAAFTLNRSSGVVDPKALSVSDLISSSDETSSSPERLA